MIVESTGILGSEHGSFSRALRKGSRAGSMYGEWKADAMERSLASAPDASARARVRSSDLRGPARMACVGALMLVRTTPLSDMDSSTSLKDWSQTRLIMPRSPKESESSAAWMRAATAS